MKTRLALILLLFLSVTACREGKTVDREAPSFVDGDSANSYIDSGEGSAIDDPAKVFREPPVVPATADEFVEPPENYTQNATIDIETKKSFIGKDVVKLWVWNDRGSQSLIMAEGSTVTLDKLEVTVAVGPIGHDEGGETVVTINGKRSRALGYREETKLGNTWVFISDFFLNAAQ